MAITLGLVEAVDDNGVYVSMPGSRGVLRGPYRTTSDVAVGASVLVAGTDDGEQVVVGVVSTPPRHAVYNVRDFGAKGDGSTDDTAAIQAAVTAATGAVAFFPPGRYRIVGQITVPDFTALRGNVAEWGQGGTGYTELIFPATGSVTGLTCGAYVVVENLLIRGPASGTSTGIAGASVHLRNMSVTSFSKGIVLTDAYYASLERVECVRNTTGLSLSGCYNVNLHGCRFSHDPDTTNTAISAGTVLSLQMFGGSIENYTTAIAVDGGGVHLFGVYFETFIPDPNKDIYGVLFYNKNGVSLLLEGCTIYLNGTDQFVYGNSSTNCVIRSCGNHFVSASSSGATQAFSLPSGTSNQVSLRDDNWMGVGDSAVSYVGGFLNSGPVESAHIELPKGYTSGAYGSDGPNIEFAGRNQMIPTTHWFGWANSVRIYSGSGDPNGEVEANPGCLYLNYDGGAGASMWVKESGWATDTGWVAK